MTDPDIDLNPVFDWDRSSLRYCTQRSTAQGARLSLVPYFFQFRYILWYFVKQSSWYIPLSYFFDYNPPLGTMEPRLQWDEESLTMDFPFDSKILNRWDRVFVAFFSLSRRSLENEWVVYRWRRCRIPSFISLRFLHQVPQSAHTNHPSSKAVYLSR